MRERGLETSLPVGNLGRQVRDSVIPVALGSKARSRRRSASPCRLGSKEGEASRGCRESPLEHGPGEHCERSRLSPTPNPTQRKDSNAPDVWCGWWLPGQCARGAQKTPNGPDPHSNHINPSFAQLLGALQLIPWVQVAEATCAAPDFGEGVGSTCGRWGALKAEGIVEFLGLLRFRGDSVQSRVRRRPGQGLFKVRRALWGFGVVGFLNAKPLQYLPYLELIVLTLNPT